MVVGTTGGPGDRMTSLKDLYEKWPEVAAYILYSKDNTSSPGRDAEYVDS